MSRLSQAMPLSRNTSIITTVTWLGWLTNLSGSVFNLVDASSMAKLRFGAVDVIIGVFQVFVHRDGYEK